jgi:hypothetical protein
VLRPWVLLGVVRVLPLFSERGAGCDLQQRDPDHTGLVPAVFKLLEETPEADPHTSAGAAAGQDTFTRLNDTKHPHTHWTGDGEGVGPKKGKAWARLLQVCVVVHWAACVWVAAALVRAPPVLANLDASVLSPFPYNGVSNSSSNVNGSFAFLADFLLSEAMSLEPKDTWIEAADLTLASSFAIYRFAY